METELPAIPLDSTPDIEEESSSLADHEAAFGPGGTGTLEPAPVETPETPETPAEKTERDQSGRFKHRAKSQKAGAEDVPRIAELTKKWRDAERRAEEAERRFTARAPEPERRATPTPSPTAGETFSFASFDQYIVDHPEVNYEDWLDARADARQEWRQAQQQQQTAKTQAETAWQDTLTTYRAKKDEFAKVHPDFESVVAACPVDGMTPVLERALLTHDKSPELVYYLAQHPEFYDEMLLLTDSKPLTEHFVAIAQRRLSARLQAAPTGSAAPLRTPTPAPRPPNPVRTGPMNTGDDPPGDESSLSDHEKYFGQKRSRR